MQSQERTSNSAEPPSEPPPDSDDIPPDSEGRPPRLSLLLLTLFPFLLFVMLYLLERWLRG